MINTSTPLAIPLPAPQPAACNDCASAARQQFSALESWLASAPALHLPFHCVESQQQDKSREIQRLLLESHVRQRGNGDVGVALRAIGESDEALYTHRRLQRRTLKTTVGPVHIDRFGYRRQGSASIHPLDEAMQLPARSFSYDLQKQLVKAAIQGPFRESTERILDSTGLVVAKRSLEEILRDATEDFDSFYAQRAPAPWQQTADILVAAVDGKGIPMVRPAGQPRTIRPAKGPRPNGKKMATVAAVFTRGPWVRTPQQVVDSLFRTEPKKDQKKTGQPVPPRPENKRVWASLTKGKEAVMQEVLEEIQRRDPDTKKTRVALTDGERALQKLVDKKLRVTLILDLFHVLERVWKAADVFNPQGGPEAELWAKLACSRILEGNVCQLIKGLRQTVTKQRLFGSKRKTLLQVAAYFDNNKQRMRYNEYLALGLPIASGPVEGACKNLIKDRMERSGMHWTESMAEAIVQLRAIYLSGDLEAYWAFHITKEQERLYPQGRWIVVVK